MGTKSDEGNLSRLVRWCAGGVHGVAATSLKVMRSRFQARDGMGVVRVRRGTESCWHAGGHRLPQDESKCAVVRDSMAPVLKELVLMSMEDIGHFEPMSCHAVLLPP